MDLIKYGVVYESKPVTKDELLKYIGTVDDSDVAEIVSLMDGAGFLIGK